MNKHPASPPSYIRTLSTKNPVWLNHINIYAFALYLYYIPAPPFPLCKGILFGRNSDSVTHYYSVKSVRIRSYSGPDHALTADKMEFLLSVSLVDMNKSTGLCGFDHTYVFTKAKFSSKNLFFCLLYKTIVHECTFSM